MAKRLNRCLLYSVLVATLNGCERSPTKPDKNPINLAETYSLAGKAYDAQNWTDSEKHYTTLAQNAPGEAEPWFKLGNIYARTSRPELALQAYQETLVRDPRHAKAWHNMAVLQLRNAGKSFSELEKLVDSDDPLYAKSIKIQNAIDELVN
ncbi:MAG: tetratricopeptide repeat protein [Proteobacteria bacterium]|nr:tetratricopeptide repeat protein [Pseudomonadota bacterium]